MDGIFVPADILMPDKTDLTKWTVVACDQFSSQREYWDETERIVGAEPSSLRLIIPEAYLREGDTQRRVEDTYRAMKSYTQSGVFRTLKRSFVYVQRTQTDGRIRHGLVGALDLEAYDYAAGAAAPVRASEHTVPSRLPVRVEIRRGAPLECPHIMTLIDDPDRHIIEPLADRCGGLEPLYDFDLLHGAGHLRGWRVDGAAADEISAAVSSCPGDVKIIVGDGNHSLAAAKEYWNELKQKLTNEQAQSHPARYALVELNNVYDEAIDFEAIHRVVFGADAGLVNDFATELGGGGYQVLCVTKDGARTVSVGASCIGELIGRVDSFIERHMSQGGAVDYIHGEETARTLAAQDGAVGFILPSMGKSDFFETVIKNGLFPKKSFSIGHAEDKRHYLECRSIRA